MTSRKLTSTLRSQIINNVLANTFGEREKAIVAAEHALAFKVYEHRLSKHLTTMSTLPHDFFPKINFLYANFAGKQAQLCLPDDKSAPYNLRYHGTWAAYERGSTEVDAYEDWSDKRDALERERNQLRAQISGLLNSFTTINRLLEAWPEGAEYIPALTAGEAPLPAIIIDDINAAISQFKAAA